MQNINDYGELYDENVILYIILYRNAARLENCKH